MRNGDEIEKMEVTGGGRCPGPWGGGENPVGWSYRRTGGGDNFKCVCLPRRKVSSLWTDFNNNLLFLTDVR